MIQLKQKSMIKTGTKMKKFTLFPMLIILISSLFLLSCADNTEADLDDKNFGCDITYPYNNASINSAEGMINVKIKTHTDTLQTLTTTLLINDAQKIVSTDSIVTYGWNVTTPGAYSIKAITVNEAGEFDEDEVQVNIRK